MKNLMFPEITRTWNPVPGCRHACSYCFARKQALGRLRHSERYKNGFVPQLIEKELRRRFPSGFIFVCDMGDLFGRWVPHEWIDRVLDVIRWSPEAIFLLLTKNPARYHDFLWQIPHNVVLGATIETDAYPYPSPSTAPPPYERFKAMRAIHNLPKMISIEPIMKFVLQRFVEMVKEVDPAFVYVGYDNHKAGLMEPSLVETNRLILRLREFTDVRVKSLREGNKEP